MSRNPIPRRPFAGASRAVAVGAVALATGVLAVPVGVQVAQAAPSGHLVQHHLCSTTTAHGYASCYGVRLENSSGQNVDRVGHALTSGRLAQPMEATTPSGGLAPWDIRHAYNLRWTRAHGRTVAIVDAHGYTNAETDLAQYRAEYKLSACTHANGCLSIMNQDGSTDADNLPADDEGWDGEQALDLDAVSATCPDCHILLVQANSSSLDDLATAVKTAARQAGVVAISNSYGSGDVADSEYGSAYHHPGIAITASTGDDGYEGGNFPASSAYVTAVGGTSLRKDGGTTRGWSETAWSGTGSGCSTQNDAPTGQSSSVTGCGGRAIADVSAVADPTTGLATYGPGGWGVVGGTSLSAPIVAAMYALSGNTKGLANAIPYAHAGQFNDVTSGSNGSCSTWCSAHSGWDAPTGLGSPNGLGGL